MQKQKVKNILSVFSATAGGILLSSCAMLANLPVSQETCAADDAHYVTKVERLLEHFSSATRTSLHFTNAPSPDGVKIEGAVPNPEQFRRNIAAHVADLKPIVAEVKSLFGKPLPGRQYPRSIPQFNQFVGMFKDYTDRLAVIEWQELENPKYEVKLTF